MGQQRRRRRREQTFKEQTTYSSTGGRGYPKRGARDGARSNPYQRQQEDTMDQYHGGTQTRNLSCSEVECLRVGLQKLLLYVDRRIKRRSTDGDLKPTQEINSSFWDKRNEERMNRWRVYGAKPEALPDLTELTAYLAKSSGFIMCQTSTLRSTQGKEINPTHSRVDCGIRVWGSSRDGPDNRTSGNQYSRRPRKR